MKKKIILTNDEIKLYNSYKNKMRLARTRQELSHYELSANKILDTGRQRYIQKLEKQGKVTAFMK